MDAGNGMAGLVAPEMFKNTNIEVIPLFFELDGNFPNHEANPLLEENRIDLVKKVKEVNADFGVGFDGDSDRCFFVNEKGEFISGDFITGLLAKYMLNKYGSGKIFYDVRCSRYVEDIVKKNNGIPFMYKVGHALAKPKMKEENALFGGEVSGHYYFKMGDYYADNSYLPVFIISEIISEENKKLSEILQNTKNYHISGEINSTVDNPDKIIEEIKQKYSNLGKVLNIDGLSIVSNKWWFNIRKSNTEPLLRLNCEADTRENMEKLRDDLLAIIRK
jgi:phosphomannomutase